MHGSIGSVLKKLRQKGLGGWLCLLGGVLHLLAPLCHACPGLSRACSYAAGRPTQVTDALGRVTHTLYDVFGQIQQVTHPDGTIVSTAYTHHGKPWVVTDELGRQTITTYDEAGRAVQVAAPTLDDSIRPTTTTVYDAASNPVRTIDPLGRVTESEYDERNRAVAVYAPPVWDGETGVFVRPLTQSSYDALGQVLTVTDPLGNVTP